MALFRLEHTTLGKTTHAPGTAAAHGWYITRPKACQLMFGINFSGKREAARRQIEEYENSLKRKNARIADKILLSLPVEMTLEQRAKTVRGFMWELTGHGKGRALACFHDQGTHNPHVHIFLVDKDETGKSVFKTSEKGSTQRIRALWEKVCNQKLTEFGIEARIDRRSRAERGMAPGQEYEDRHRNAPKYPQKEFEAESAPDHPEEQTQEALMAEIIQFPNAIQGVARADEELTRLLAVKDFRQQLVAKLDTIVKELLRHEERAQTLRTVLGAAEQAHHKAEADLNTHKGAFGRLRGFKILGYTSPARRKANVAQTRLSSARNILGLAQYNLDASNRQYRYLAAEVTELTRQREEIEQQMAVWGNLHEITQAEDLLRNTIAHYSQQLDEPRLRRAYLQNRVSEADFNRAMRVLHQAKSREQTVANEGMAR